MAGTELLKGISATARIYILFVVLYALAIGALLSYWIAIKSDAI